MGRGEALDLVKQAIDLSIPYVAFGGGEPLNVPFAFDLFEMLASAGVAVKLETNGRHIDGVTAARLHALGIECIQISLDGATAETHQAVRPGSSFEAALAAIDRLVALGTAPQLVFAPTVLNIHEIVPAFELAVRHGCSAFVTGPLMRLGRAAAAWNQLACDQAAWEQAAVALRERAAEMNVDIALNIYPWDIVTELACRLESPQAMLLIVPNGRIKLLNALPFAPADLRRESLAQAWQAYRVAWRMPEVRDFVTRCQTDPGLLKHANEIWDMPNFPLSPQP